MIVPGIRSSRMQVGFYGTRGSISTPGRATEKYGGNTPCVSITCGDTLLVFDAGTGIRPLGLELAREYASHPEDLSVHLFLSHTHWDHIQGIPFFAPAYMKGVSITIYGSPSRRGFLEQVLRGQMDANYFPIDMSSLAADLKIVEIDEPVLQVGPMMVDWEEQMYHPGGCIRFRVWLNNRRVVYATDIELDAFFGDDATDEQKQHQQQYVNFIGYADLLVGDGQYTASEYDKRVGWGHSTVELLTEIAHHANVKNLAVFHHDPERADMAVDKLWREVHPKYMSGKPSMNVFWAREGQVVPA